MSLHTHIVDFEAHGAVVRGTGSHHGVGELAAGNHPHANRGAVEDDVETSTLAGADAAGTGCLPSCMMPIAALARADMSV